MVDLGQQRVQLPDQILRFAILLIYLLPVVGLFQRFLELLALGQFLPQLGDLGESFRRGGLGIVARVERAMPTLMSEMSLG